MLRDQEKDEAYCFDNIELYYMDDLEFYEWIEEEAKEIKVSYKSMSEIVDSMAQEICNLRSMDLTDDNIRLIIEEFS